MTSTAFKDAETFTPSGHFSNVHTAFVVALSTVAFAGVSPPRNFKDYLADINFSPVEHPTAPRTEPRSELSNSSFNASSSGQNVEAKTAQSWLTESLDRIEKLGSFPADWAGEGYVKASSSVVGDAERFILKLAHSGVNTRPAIGLDDDGSFSFHISDEGLIADLSIHPDGTYSYYAKRGSAEAFSETSKINGPLDQNLLDILKA